MASTRKDPRLGFGQKDLVNLSVRAQDIILKQGPQASLQGALGLLNGPSTYKTTDDLQFLKSGAVANHSVSIRENATNVTTNISQEEHSRLISILNKSQVHEVGDQLLLPSIKTNRMAGQQSPFKANNSLFDNSLIGQRMRKTTLNDKPLDITLGNKKHAPLIEEGIGALLKENPFKGAHSVERKSAQVKMNPKVLETWINETLQDAEHLDIPGVILKPEHKNPISRYGIDRLALTNAGIPNELVDRIFRALFVYSVGFYELIKKCLQHTEKKYSIITAIWKVFSILLEYCCKTDYRMLISEISKEHKEELDKLEKEFQAKFQEQAHNERILKQNMEILQKYNEELEKDRTNERQMRLKLEEEYMQNTKNHEEEVQLRLKFESKLNNMHSVHRDLETRYKRALNELASLQNTNEQLVNKNNAQLDEMTVLKTIKAENESRIAYNEEKLQSLQREINIKIKQVEDYEDRYTKTQDELDLTKYKLQESQKDITELKLKGDVYDSQVNGLKNEKQHLQLELKETKELLKIYESKCSDLMGEINQINVDYQESKREIIGFGEIQKERDERIEKLKRELRELKVVHEDLDLKHGTLSIQYEKVREQYDTCKRDLDDAIEKLHVTNKVRHETEVKLHEEIDKTKTLNDIIKDKEETLQKRTQEIEELDKKVIELERQNEALEIKKAGVERQYELTKKQLNEKVQNLNDVLTSEKETREMWIERYEKEQRDHTSTNAQLLAAKSQLKDQVLQSKNAEIKLQTQIKANEVLSESNIRLQDNLNESLARCENLERELNTQKEIMRQMNESKKDYIQKLKRELETVESRFAQRFDQIQMISEDYHSRASKNWIEFTVVKIKYHETQDLLDEANKIIMARDLKIDDLEVQVKNLEMHIEELLTRWVNSDQDRASISNILSLVKGKVDNLEAANKHLKIEADQKQKYQNEYNMLLLNNTQLKKELQKSKMVPQNATNIGGQQTLSHQQTITNNQTTLNLGERSDAQVQTTLLSQNIDQLNLALQKAQQLSQQSDITPKMQGVRVGGGGEIKKPIKKAVNSNSISQQQPSFQIGGISALPGNQGSQQDYQQTIITNQSQVTMSKKNSIQSQGNQSNATIQSQKNTISQKNLDISTTPKNNQQIISSMYPQTTTNQQKGQQIQQNDQKLYDSQMASPRNQVQINNLMMSQQMNDFTSTNQDETIISKVSPHNNNNYNGAEIMDNHTISSILQSPQGTIQMHYQSQASKMMGNINLQHTTLLDSSQIVLNQDYQTIQSNVQLHNMSQEDPSYLTNQNILASYNQQISSGRNQQVANPYENHSVILEQQYEDDEERGRTPIDGQNRSSQGYNTIQDGQQSNTNQGRLGTNHSHFTQGKKSTKLMVQYNGMNTVMMQQPSNKILNDNSQIQYQNAIGQMPGSSKNVILTNNNQLLNNQIGKSRLSDNQIRGSGGLQSNQSMQQRYDFDNNNLGEERLSDPQLEDDEEEDEEQYTINPDYQQQTDNRGNSRLLQDSFENQQQTNYNMQQQLQTNAQQSRMKVDVNSTGERRLPNNMAINNNLLGNLNNNNNNNNINHTMQSPLSQGQSVYSSNVIQNKFGLQTQNNTTGTQLNQEMQNRKVKGKTSIRSLIKSAATRDNH